MEQLEHIHNESAGDRIPESIKSAAIMFGNDMYTGTNHAIAIRELAKVHPDWREHEYPKEGFLTNRKRFVDRDEAGKIADRAEQLNHLDADVRKDASSNLDSYNLLH